MKVLLTGAAGKLGEACCDTLCEAGHQLVAVDQKYAKGLPVRVQIADLLDEKTTYRLAEDCDAVVHLANHTNGFALPLAQRVLAENVAMNANVFRACQEMGVKRFVFASSVQAMFGYDPRVGDEEPVVPYLPLDSELPARPQNNPYSLSKEIGERLLALMSAGDAELRCTALRFPLLAGERWRKWLAKGGGWGSYERLGIHEGMSYLGMEDAATLVAAVLARETPGFHVCFPACTRTIKGWSLAQVIERFYPNVPLRRPLTELDGLIDIRSITEKYGWKPRAEPVVLEIPEAPPER